MIDLANQEIFAAIKEEAEDVLASDDGQRAYIFIDNLPLALATEQNQSLASARPDLLAAYQAISDQLSFVAIPSLKAEEIAELFKNKLLLGLRQTRTDLTAKLKAALLGISAFASRDELRKKLRETLTENQQRLGAMAIVLGGATVNPTIGNWLKKYERQLGVKTIGSLDLNQFLANDKDIKNLSQTDQAMARRLFGLYEYLKLSSQTPEGLEDPVIFDFDGNLKKLSGGQFEDLKLESKVKAILDNIFKVYNKEYGLSQPSPVATIDLNKAISASRDILNETKGDKKVLFNKLSSVLAGASQDQGLAIILLLAQLRNFDDLLSDERFLGLIRDDLKNAGQNDKVNELRLNPTASQFMARLMKIILQDKLKLGETDALAFGRKLSRILAAEGEKYANIVSEDGKGGLKWNL